MSQLEGLGERSGWRVGAESEEAPDLVKCSGGTTGG